MAAYSLPPEGSKVRLVGLRNPSLNGQLGIISKYNEDGERVMISLVHSSPSTPGVIKVKPKQIELVSDRGVGGSSSRIRRRDPGRSQRNFNANSYGYGGGSVMSDDMSLELVDVLKSADDMFENADTSGDGLISQEEFEYYMKRHSGHSKDMIREAFHMIDVDGDGEITKDEVRRAFIKKRREMMGKTTGSSGRSYTSFDDELLQCSKDADELFQRADVSGDGFLSKREFEVYMKRNTTHSDMAIRELFSMMDVDHDGYITRDEVREVFLKQRKHARGGGGGSRGNRGKVSMQELLNVGDDDLHELADDVYNMFFLSETYGQAFFYALSVYALKTTLFAIIATDLWQNKEFPDKSEISTLVKSAQFLLLPVACAIQEEVIVTFFLYGNITWHPCILELNPQAYKWKYHACNMLRLSDGLLFLFVNTCVLLQATDVLNMFLSFAALAFLQTIDNIGLQLARQGYLTEILEQVANDVLLMKLPKNDNEKLQLLDSVLLFITYILLVIAWLIVCVV